jgi:hypothetical protein
MTSCPTVAPTGGPCQAPLAAFGPPVARLLPVPANLRTHRASAVSFLIALALLFAPSACSEDQTCMFSSDCASGQICAAPGQGPLHCLDACAPDGTCRPGFICDYVTGGDCLTCQVVIRACVVAPPPPSKL